jgi:hypothetical protein
MGQGSNRWAAGGCMCCGCVIHFTVLGCWSRALNGAVVTIESGMTVVAAGATDAMGHLDLVIPSAGTYTRVITFPGYATITLTSVLNCGDVLTVNMSPDSAHHCGVSPPAPQTLWCCNAEPIPDYIYWTDALGTVSFPIPSGIFVNINVDRSVQVCSVVTIMCGGIPYDTLVPVTGNSCFTYSLDCASNGGLASLQLSISWLLVWRNNACPGGGTTSVHAFAKGGCAAPDQCGFVSAGGGVNIGTSFGNPFTGTCSNNVLSATGTMPATLTDANGRTYTNPVGTSGLLTA